MKRHIILIHGAWQGGWAFGAWTPLLQAAGWQTHAVDLPGNGAHGEGSVDLEGYTRYVVQCLERLDGPAVVVGHSGGGITASQVAEAVPERVAALVYLAGMMLPSGLSFNALIAQCFASDPGFAYTGVEGDLEWDAKRQCSRVPPAAARALFLHDCAPATAEEAAARLTPQRESGRALVNQLSEARFGSVPRIYVECRQDRSVTPALQQRMQVLTPGAQHIELDCGHVPQLACPEALTEALEPLLMRALSQARSPASFG